LTGVSIKKSATGRKKERHRHWLPHKRPPPSGASEEKPVPVALIIVNIAL
jgi:hypothetical protein